MPYVLGAVVAATLFTARPAHASDPNPNAAAKCLVQVIHALGDGQGVDGKITKLKPYFEKAPFTAWKRFQLLDEKRFDVAPNDTDRFNLPNGKQLAITYVDHVKRSDGKHRLRLRLEIEDAGKKLLNTTFVIDEGGTVLEAGQKHGSGLLVLALSCETPK